jgi:hypothetical protein
MRIAGRATADNIIREIAIVVATIDDYPFAGRARDEIRKVYVHSPLRLRSYFIA